MSDSISAHEFFKNPFCKMTSLITNACSRCLIRATVGVPESTKFIILIPPTAVAKLLQYSGSRVEHGDEFSSYKMICSDSKW